MITNLTFIFAVVALFTFIVLSANAVLKDEIPMSALVPDDSTTRLICLTSVMLLMPLMTGVSQSATTIIMPSAVLAFAGAACAFKASDFAKRELIALACETIAMLFVVWWNAVESNVYLILSALIVGALPLLKYRGRFFFECALLIATAISVLFKTIF